MLYATTNYGNVKPRHRVRHLPTGGRGGGHPQATPSSGAPSRSTATATATACWSVRPARGDPSTRSVLIRKKPRQKAGLKGYERSSHSGKIAPDSESPVALTSSPDEAFFRETAKSPGRPYCNGLPGPISSPHGETHFRKRSNLSGHGASRAAAHAALLCLRSYRQQNQTLLSQSPPLPFHLHGATRCSPERGSPLRLQLLRSVAPLSQQHD
jgi:hypothetical protein